jgi:membrane protein YdbS with pleckstrin-like domain
MKISKPKNITWWISVILGILGVLGTFVSIPVVSGAAIWFVVAGLALLALGCVVKGL